MVVHQIGRTPPIEKRAERPETPATIGARFVRANAIAAANRGTGTEPGERNCSVARTLDIVSDAWAFLVIREAFFETRTFEAFRVALGIPRATLTDRLRKLTRLGIFKRVAAASGQRMDYRLTQKGFDLYPSFVALMQFGDRWLSGGRVPPLALVHTL